MNPYPNSPCVRSVTVSQVEKKNIMGACELAVVQYVNFFALLFKTYDLLIQSNKKEILFGGGVICSRSGYGFLTKLFHLYIVTTRHRVFGYLLYWNPPMDW